MNQHNDFSQLEIPLIAELFTLYQFTHGLIFSLPKFERYTLGEKIERAILEGVEAVVIANGADRFEKERWLLRANAKIEIIKLFYRLALNCRLIEQGKYLVAQQQLQTAGKMIQGWIKYARRLN